MCLLQIKKCWGIVLNKNHRQIIEMLSLISQLAITMLVPIAMCTFIAWWIGEKCNASYLSVIGFFIGAIAGFRSDYILIRKYLKK